MTTKGRVKAISAKPTEDYMGLKIQGGDWFNGDNEDFPEMSKGDKVEIKHSENNWINEINVLEEDSEDGQSRKENSDGPTGGETSDGPKTSSSTDLSPRQANIMANSATKMAVENAEIKYSEDKAKHIEEVDEKSQAYQNIMKQRLGENL